MLFDNILSTIGKTPLIKLNKLASGLEAKIYVKVEAFNPGGSIKDRIALQIIEDAENKGLLRSDSTIIEATAGNTGIGLALVCAVKGYKMIFVVPEKMSSEKINLLKAFGADVIVVPNAPPDSPDNYNNYADRLAREIPNSFRPSQFKNLNNPIAHYQTTAREIYEDLNGAVDVLVAGVGTGGTISGVGKFLKEKNPNVYIIVADPAGSVLSGDTPKPYKVEGIGEDFVPKTFNPQIVDEFIRVEDEESFNIARQLAHEEGILTGGSSGTALAAALRFARRENRKMNIVVILPDTGRNYLSKFYSDSWMEISGFRVNPVKYSASDIIKYKPDQFKQLLAVNSNTKMDIALKIMSENGISQLLIAENEKIIGILTEKSILIEMKRMSLNSFTLVKDIMSPLPPIVGPYTDIEDIKKLLFTSEDFILVGTNDLPQYILTRIDLIQFLLKVGG